MSKQPLIENLEYLKETKQKIKEAIESKGVSILEEDTFRSYADKIKSITQNIIQDYKKVSPKRTSISVVPDDGYDGIAQVVVEEVNSSIDENIKEDNIKEGVNILGVVGKFKGAKLQSTKEITPKIESQIIKPDYGYNGLEQVEVNAVTSDIDSNIISENIRNGVEILGVSGTLVDNQVQSSKDAVPKTEPQEITPDAGFDGIARVNISAVDSSIDSNITPNNIKKGVNILGIDGSFEGKSNIPSGGNIGDILTKNGTQDNDIVWKSYNNILLYKGNIPNLESIPELTQESAKADIFNLNIPVFDITTFELTDEEKASIGADVHQHYFAWKIGNNILGMSTDNEANFRGISIQQNYEVIDGTTHINKSMFTYINASTSSPVYINYYIDDNNFAGVYTQLDGDNYEQHKETGLIEFTKPAVIIFNGNLDAEYYLQNISTSLYNLYFMSSDDAEMQRLMPFTGPFLSFYANPEPGVSRRYGYKTMTRGNFSYSDKMVMITTDVLLNKKMFLTNELNNYYHQYDMYTVGEDMLIYVILNNQFVRFSSYYTKKEIDDMFYTVEEALDKIIEGE